MLLSDVTLDWTRKKEADLFDRHSTNSLREALRLLRRTEALLDSPTHWTKHAWALNKARRPVAYNDRRAFAWCLAGAVMRANSDLYGGDIEVWMRPPKPEIRESSGRSA